MNSIFFTLITVAVILAAVVFIIVMLELRTAIKALKGFISTTEYSVKPTLDELQMTLSSIRDVTGSANTVSRELQLTLRGIRDITDNVTIVTEDVKTLSSSVREIGVKARHVSELIEDVTVLSTSKVSGLKAGLRAAAEVLVKGLLTGKTG